MLVIFIIVGLFIGLILKGSFKNFEKATLHALWLPIISFTLEIIGKLLCLQLIPRNPYYAFFVVGSYLCSFLFVYYNRHVKWFFYPALLGVFLNFLVISLNNFYMPVSNIVVAKVGSELTGTLAVSYQPVSSLTRLAFLGDIIYCPFPQGFASIGDLFLGIGIVFLMIYILRPDHILFATKK